MDVFKLEVLSDYFSLVFEACAISDLNPVPPGALICEVSRTVVVTFSALTTVRHEHFS